MITSVDSDIHPASVQLSVNPPLFVPQTIAKACTARAPARVGAVTGHAMVHHQTHSSDCTCNIDSHLSMINWIYKKKLKNEWKQASFVLHFALPAMQMVHRKGTFSSLGSQSSHTALVEKAQLCMDSITIQINSMHQQKIIFC